MADTKPDALSQLSSVEIQSQLKTEVEKVRQEKTDKRGTVCSKLKNEKEGEVSKRARDILAEEPIDLFPESEAPDIAKEEQDWSEEQDKQSVTEGNLETNTENEDIENNKTGKTVEVECSGQIEGSDNELFPNHPSENGKENQSQAIFSHELCELVPGYDTMYSESNCTVCLTPVKFNSPMALLKHLKEEHALKVFKCKFCDRVTLTQWSIVRHCHKAHQAGRFACEACEKVNVKPKVSFVWLHELISHYQDQHPSNLPGKIDSSCVSINYALKIQ